MNYQKIHITPKMANKSFHVEWCHDGIVMKCSVFCSDFANSWGGQIDECSYNGVDIILNENQQMYMLNTIDHCVNLINEEKDSSEDFANKMLAVNAIENFSK